MRLAAYNAIKNIGWEVPNQPAGRADLINGLGT